jgi:hypothetical protein
LRLAKCRPKRSWLSPILSDWSSGARPAKVRRLMQTLNDAASAIWTDGVKLAISRASALITFSNFPVGLLTFPGDSAPLVYRLPVTHRRLAPLTAALHYEFGPSPRIDLSRGFRVLVAECVSLADPVGRLSRSGWRMAEEMLEASPSNVSMTRVDVASAAELDAAIDSHEPDVLVISAHGTEVDGVARLRVGKDFYGGGHQRRWPNVVILSACRVARRGAGGPNTADRILEQGAVAVLAAHVEVDVRHNALPACCAESVDYPGWLCGRHYAPPQYLVEGPTHPSGNILRLHIRRDGGR